MRWMQKTLAVGAGVALAAAAGLSQAGAPDPDFAALAVSRAVGQEFHWTTRREQLYRNRRAVMLSGPDANAEVDKETGILLSFFRKTQEAVPAQPPRFSLAQARATASAFVERAGVPLTAPWILIQEQYLDHATNNREYEFEWTKFFHGVQLPSFVFVWVDAISGEVRCYFVIDDPVTVPIQSRITAADAVRAVARASGIRQPVIEKSHPVIWYRPAYPGPQVLYWKVVLRNPSAEKEADSSVEADVDPVSGRILSLRKPDSIDSNRRRLVNSKTETTQRVPALNLKAASATPVPRTIFEARKRGTSIRPNTGRFER